MNSRMDKYKELIPSRSDKYKDLYKQVYNVNDEFENLVVPSNAREIKPEDLKKEITTRYEYKKTVKINEPLNINNELKKKEHEDESIYDIKELLNKAVSSEKKPELIEPTLANEDYLKRLKLDPNKTNIEQVKEIYDEILSNDEDNDTSVLSKTANLSLEILSDLKGDNEETLVSPPIKDSELPSDSEVDFYSNNYKFSKKDFEDKDIISEEVVSEKNNFKFFLKILLLIFGICLVIVCLIYLYNYFKK